MIINNNFQNINKGNKEHRKRMKVLNKSYSTKNTQIFDNNCNIYKNLNLINTKYNANTYNDVNVLTFNNINNGTNINANYNNITSKYNFAPPLKEYQNKKNKIGQRNVKNNLEEFDRYNISRLNNYNNENHFLNHNNNKNSISCANISKLKNNNSYININRKAPRNNNKRINKKHNIKNNNLNFNMDFENSNFFMGDNNRINIPRYTNNKGNTIDIIESINNNRIIAINNHRLYKNNDKNKNIQKRGANMNNPFLANRRNIKHINNEKTNKNDVNINKYDGHNLLNNISNQNDKYSTTYHTPKKMILLLNKLNIKKKLLNNFASTKNNYNERKQLVRFNKNISINELDEADINLDNYDNNYNNDINLANQNNMNINKINFLKEEHINNINNLSHNENEINDSGYKYINNYYADYSNNNFEQIKNKNKQITKVKKVNKYKKNSSIIKKSNHIKNIKNECENIINISNEINDALENNNNNENEDNIKINLMNHDIIDDNIKNQNINLNNDNNKENENNFEKLKIDLNNNINTINNGDENNLNNNTNITVINDENNINDNININCDENINNRNRISSIQNISINIDSKKDNVNSQINANINDYQTNSLNNNLNNNENVDNINKINDSINNNQNNIINNNMNDENINNIQNNNYENEPPFFQHRGQRLFFFLFLEEATEDKNVLRNILRDRLLSLLFGSSNNIDENRKQLIDNLLEYELDKVDKLEESNKKCVICLEHFNNCDKIISLPCVHIYHSDCIKKWLLENNFCPICKYVFNEDDFNN